MVMGAIWDNPIIIFLIISLLGWFFQRDKQPEEPDNKPNRKYTSPPINKDEPVEDPTQTVVRNQDEDIRRKIQERERELKKKLSQQPDWKKEATSLAQTIKEQYEAQKKKAMQTEKPVVIQETMAEIKVPKELKPLVQKAVKQTEVNRVQPVKRGFDVRNIDLQEAFIMSEILGPPRSKRKQIR